MNGSGCQGTLSVTYSIVEIIVDSRYGLAVGADNCVIIHIASTASCGTNLAISIDSIAIISGSTIIGALIRSDNFEIGTIST